MRPAVLSVQQLSVRYENTSALDQLHFQVYEGERVALIGPNGAGKSTLMQALMGLLPIPAESRIVVDRQRLGYVPQHQHVDWSFPVTVFDVVLMGLSRQIGWLRFPQRQHRQQVEQALARVSLAELAHRPIGELSGGQKQRVFIARALVQNADILLLDEPFAGVDIGAQQEVMGILDLLDQQGVTVLLSTHDLHLAASAFPRVMALNKRLVRYGTPQEVFCTDVLQALYGTSLATFPLGSQMALFVDEHAHCDGEHAHDHAHEHEAIP